MKKSLLMCFLGFSIIFLSCNTLKEPKTVEDRIDYSKEDIVAIEVERISKLLDEDPVKALWRAGLLGDESLIEQCLEYCVQQYKVAVEENDYLEASRYYNSLRNFEYDFPADVHSDMYESFIQNVPGVADNSDKIADTIGKCMNATATIWVDRGIKFQNGAGFQDVVIGSGFFIDKRGYLITNHHVIESMVDEKYEGFSRLYIKLLSDIDTKIPAKVVGYDAILDLALLKVEIEPEYVLELGSSSELHIGDKVSVIGTPLGFEGTLTSGIVSSVDRKLLTLGNVFQIDAAVNSGNSGGPLIDENLKVQAIVFAGVPKYQGLNFAIPVEYLKQELSFLYSGQELTHPWLSAYGHTKRNGNKKIGVEVQYVVPGGTAFTAGLRAGDVITEVNGKTVSSIEELQFLFMSYQSASIVTCKYLDEEENEKEVMLYLEQRPKDPLLRAYKNDFIADSFVPIFGMKLIRSSTLSRKSYKITKIIKGSAADEMGFSEGDPVIVRDVKFDDENKTFYAQIQTQRRKKDILDLVMIIGASYDNPYYF